MNNQVSVKEHLILCIAITLWLCGFIIPFVDYPDKNRDLYRALESRDYANAVGLVSENKFDLGGARFFTPFSIAVNEATSKNHDPDDNLRWFNLVKFMLEYGADINSVDRVCNTALHTAASRGDVTMVEFLISRNAILDRQNCHGQTPAMISAKLGHETAMNLLVSEGADIELISTEGKSVLDYAMDSGISVSTVR